MPTDLFFSQPVSPNPPPAIRNGLLEPSGLNQPPGTQTSPPLPEGDRDNFLTTLKKVSHNQIPTKLPRDNDGSPSSDSAVSEVDGEIDETTGPAVSSIGMTSPNEPDTEPVQIPSDWNFAAFIKVLEGMGVHDAIGGSDSQKLSDVNPSDGNQLAAIKMLIARLQQNQSAPTVELQAGLERLQQFVASALEGKVLMPIDGAYRQGLSPGQVTELDQISQWLRGLPPGLQEQKGNSGFLMGEGATDAKLSGTMPAETGVGAAWTVGSSVMNGSNRETGFFQSAENSVALSQLENQSGADPNFLRENRTSKQTETANRMAPAPDHDQPSTTETTRDSQPQKPNTSSGMNPSIAKFSESLIQSTSSEEPLSKVFQEAQLAKEGVLRVESGSIEETVSKVIKTEAGPSDHGLLSSSGQNTEKPAEPASIQKETEASQSDLRNQTMDQIVRKAAIHLRNGQHEARIDLKPDFLGHIRMQVISENQQVTVKILTEHGFVKDMIESNVHQLKADLQQQGLEVDKLEVTVSRDSENSGNFKDKFAQSKARQNHSDHQNEDDPAREKQGQTGEPVRTADGARTVDYFA